MKLVKILKGNRYHLIFHIDEKSLPRGHETLCGMETSLLGCYVVSFPPEKDGYPRDYLKNFLHCDECAEKACKLGFKFEEPKKDPEDELDKALDALDTPFGSPRVSLAINHIRNAKENLDD